MKFKPEDFADVVDDADDHPTKNVADLAADIANTRLAEMLAAAPTVHARQYDNGFGVWSASKNEPFGMSTHTAKLVQVEPIGEEEK